MKRYNLSKIMTRAWQLHRLPCKATTFGDCLSRAWYEEKIAVEIEEQKGQEFRNGMSLTAYGITRTISRWTKNGHDRVYINDRRKSDGYVDLVTKRVYTRSYGYLDAMTEIILTLAM